MDINVGRYVGGSINDSSFIIRLLIEEDKGKYFCEIVNVVGFVLKDVMLGNVNVLFVFYI